MRTLPDPPFALSQVLGTVYRATSGFLLKKAGLTRATCHIGAVTLIQRVVVMGSGFRKPWIRLRPLSDTHRR